MVKKSTKSKSKRKSFSVKIKSIRKAVSTERKKRRLAKLKAREDNALGIKKRSLKDAGVVSSWPFREDFLKEMQWEKKRILAMNQQAKINHRMKQIEENLKKRLESNEEMNKDDKNKLETLHERKFFNDVKKVIRLSDVILEVLDARNPLKCRSEDIEKSILKCPGKRLVLILTKIDLIPEEIREKWLKYLKSELPVIAFKSSTQNQNKNIGRAKKNIMHTHSQICAGAENLLQLLKNYCRNVDIKTSITVGVIGMPNVGKSSIINSLARSHVTSVGNQPGITRNIKEIHLDKTIRLLDTPGIITTNKDGLIQGTLKIDKLKDPIGIVEYITELVDKKILCEVYNIDNFNSNVEFIEKASLKMGMLKKGHIADMEAGARKISQDWNNGIIPYYTIPPKRFEKKSLKIVQQWAEEFDIDALDNDKKDNFEGEIRTLINRVTLSPETEFKDDELIEEIQNETNLEVIDITKEMDIDIT